jgi:hypothetical protein
VISIQRQLGKIKQYVKCFCHFKQSTPQYDDLVLMHSSQPNKGKGKVIPVHHAMKTYWGVAIYLYAFLTSVLDEGEWSASCPGHLTPRVRVPGTHWIGGWVGASASASMDTLVKGKNTTIAPCQELNSGFPAQSLVIILNELPWLPPQPDRSQNQNKCNNTMGCLTLVKCLTLLRGVMDPPVTSLNKTPAT